MGGKSSGVRISCERLEVFFYSKQGIWKLSQAGEPPVEPNQKRFSRSFALPTSVFLDKGWL
jgi:hypothetical protein